MFQAENICGDWTKQRTLRMNSGFVQIVLCFEGKRHKFSGAGREGGGAGVVLQGILLMNAKMIMIIIIMLLVVVAHCLQISEIRFN